MRTSRHGKTAFCLLLAARGHAGVLPDGQQLRANASRELRSDADLPGARSDADLPGARLFHAELRRVSSSQRVRCLSEYLLASSDIEQLASVSDTRTRKKLLERRLDTSAGVVPVCVRGRDGSHQALFFSSRLASETRLLETWPNAVLLHRSKLVLFEAMLDERSTAGDGATECDIPEYVDAYNWRNASAVFRALRVCRQTTDNAGNMIWAYGARRLLGRRSGWPINIYNRRSPLRLRCCFQPPILSPRSSQPPMPQTARAVKPTRKGSPWTSSYP